LIALKSSPLKEGFLAMPEIKALKMDPIPEPAPTKPMVVKLAPINLAACTITAKLFLAQEHFAGATFFLKKH
jgi:hypothetical protein